MYKKIPNLIGLTFGLFASIFLLSFATFAVWQGPTLSPPSGNIPYPITAGDLPQMKEGNLIVQGTLQADGGIIPVSADSIEARPTCDSSNRGMMFSVHGGTGEKDRKFVCYQDGGNYYWEQTAPDWREEASTTIKEGLVGHWTFNEGSGTTAYDYSGNNNHGTLSNPNWPQGEGWALDFDGTDDYIDAGNDASLNFTTEDFTTGFWIKVGEVTDTYGGIVADYNTGQGWIIAIAGANQALAFYDAPTDTWNNSVTSPLNDGLYHHVVTVKEGTILYVYLDGIEVNQISVSAVFDSDINESIEIGRYTDDRNYDGQIDDVRIYNRALSASEISDLYNGKEVSTEGLVGWWAMNEGEDATCPDGTDVCDLSGNANHGTNNGATWLDGRGPTFEETTQGQALEFGGLQTGDYVSLGSSTELNPSEVSIGAWVNPRTLSNYNYIYSNSRDCCGTYKGIDFRIRSGVEFGIWNNSKAVAIGGNITLNEWQYVTGTYDGNVIKAYLNGEEVASTDSSLGIGQPASYGNYIGALASHHGSLGLDGQIDDVRIYNRALRPEEVRYLYETTYRD
jgi:hypothetical protein